jgi:hypothetical protein
MQTCNHFGEYPENNSLSIATRETFFEQDL